jgi:hypothetical protein
MLQILPPETQGWLAITVLLQTVCQSVEVPDDYPSSGLFMATLLQYPFQDGAALRWGSR